MPQVIEPVYYENSGSPVTGLTPTATAEDTTTGEMPTCTVTALATDGWYKIEFDGIENHKYAVSVDAGTDSVDNRKQAYSLTAVRQLSRRGGGGGGFVSITKEQMDYMAQEMAKAVPKTEIPEVSIPDYTKDIKAVQKDIKALEKKLKEFTDSLDFEPEFKTLESNLQQKLGEFRQNFDEELEQIKLGLAQEAKGIEEKREENAKKVEELFKKFQKDWLEMNSEFGRVLTELKKKIEKVSLEGEDIKAFEQFVNSRNQNLIEQFKQSRNG